jgi:predicted NUDIX family phosphoesterase
MFPRAIIYAGEKGNSVNLVHFGVVYFIDIDNDKISHVQLREEGKQLAWMTKEELKENYDELEVWSQFVVDKCL